MKLVYSTKVSSELRLKLNSMLELMQRLDRIVILIAFKITFYSYFWLLEYGSKSFIDSYIHNGTVKGTSNFIGSMKIK